MIVTEAGMHPNVSTLVYDAARAADAGEDCTALTKQFPTAPAAAGIVVDSGNARLTEDTFIRDLAPDLPPAKARALYARAMADSQGTHCRQNRAGGVAVQALLRCGLHG